MGLFAKKHGNDDLHLHCMTNYLPYITAAVRLSPDEMRSFVPQAYDYWYQCVLAGLLELQADTLEAKSKGITLEKWKEEVIQIPCRKCVERKQWVAKKTVLRLDDSTGRVACSWCGYEELDIASVDFVGYMNMNDHIESFWAGKFYRLIDAGFVISPNGIRAQDKMLDENSLDGVPLRKPVDTWDIRQWYDEKTGWRSSA
jgi:hypothetical protein